MIHDRLLLLEAKERFPYAYEDAMLTAGHNYVEQAEHIRVNWPLVYAVIADEVERELWSRFDPNRVYDFDYNLNTVIDHLSIMKRMREE